MNHLSNANGAEKMFNRKLDFNKAFERFLAEYRMDRIYEKAQIV